MSDLHSSSRARTCTGPLCLRALTLALFVLAGACADVGASRGDRAAIDTGAQRIRADVEWLADDAREGRRAGTEQGRVAGEWIADRFAELGLEPAGEDGYLQEFDVPLPARDGGRSRVRARGETSASAQHVVPLFCSTGGSASGPIAYRGYGIVDAEKGWDDYADLETKGAVVLILRGAPAEPEVADASAPAPAHDDTKLVTRAAGFGNSASLFAKAMEAKRHGAVAVLVAPGEQHEDDPLLPFDASRSANAGIPALVVSDELAARLLFPDASAEERQTSYRKVVRVVDVRVSVDAPADVEIEADVVRERGPAVNVLGRLAGEDRSRTVVVGAHYDHLGHGGDGSLAPKETGSIHNGADDNASGTAVVLEMARAMKARGTPPCDVLFALWSGEEIGLLGSEHWTEHPTLPVDGIVANLNLDMVGRAGNGKLQVLGAGTAEEFASWMDAAESASGLELVVSLQGGALGGSSDHQSFLKRKIPALHLFSGLHADYHKPSDDADKLEADGAARVALLGVELVERMAGAEKLSFVAPKMGDKDRPEIKSGFSAWFGSLPNYAFDGTGVKIDGTSPGSPAERAGFVGGDILLKMGDVEIANIYDFMYGLQLYKPGDVVLVRYLRDGSGHETRVTLSSRQQE